MRRQLYLRREWEGGEPHLLVHLCQEQLPRFLAILAVGPCARQGAAIACLCRGGCSPQMRHRVVANQGIVAAYMRLCRSWSQRAMSSGDMPMSCWTSSSLHPAGCEVCSCAASCT